MRLFINRHADKITGVVSGFDRLVFRGRLPWMCYELGVYRFLAEQGVLLKHFGDYVQGVTARIRKAATAVADRFALPTKYLESSNVSKEEIARAFLAERPRRSGPVCLLSAVEPCWTWQVRRSRTHEHDQELRRRSSKCLHYYLYFFHHELGFGHVRVQTWMPYTVQVCVNGREWLGRQLQRARLRHTKVANSFPSIASPDRAQRICDRLLTLPWPPLLDQLAREANPALSSIIDVMGRGYDWMIHQSEWATDVMFRDTDSLSRCYPALVRHAISNLGSRDVLRFLGKRNMPCGSGEVTSSYRQRVEGIRVKHLVRANSVKMYDKAGSVLRVETTINRPDEFQVRRKAQGSPDSSLALRPIRKNVADIKRLVRAAQSCNSRYLDALSVVENSETVAEIVLPVTEPTTIGDRRVRGLRPWAEPDLALLRAISAGELCVNGFRNRDVLARLFPDKHRPHERKKLSARVTRLLRLLRAHAVIEKVEGTHRYHVTDSGRRLVAAVVAAGAAPLSLLEQCA